MNEYLLRDDAPLSNEDWERVDHIVVEVAQKLLTENERLLALDGRVRGVMSVHTTFSCSGPYIQQAKEIARRHDALFQMHVFPLKIASLADFESTAIHHADEQAVAHCQPA